MLPDRNRMHDTRSDTIPAGYGRPQASLSNNDDVERQSYMQMISKARLSAGLVLLATSLLQVSVAGTASAQDVAAMELTLQQAIDLALKQNRSLKLTQLDVIDSEQKKRIAQADYFPRIKNESTAFHITDLQQLVIPGGSLGTLPATGPLPPQTAVIGQGTFTAYTSGTGLSQPLTQMFKIHNESRAATADVNSAKIQVNAAENDVALRVKQLYYGILIAQLKGKAAKEEADSAQVKLEESTSSVQQGSALEVTALESRAAVLDAKQTVLTESLQVRDLTVELNNLMGMPLNTKLELSEDLPDAPASIATREECLRTAREQSPQIRIAQQALEKAKAELAATKDAFIPDLSGFARYSYQSGIPFLVHNFGTFGILFEYELFDGGRRKAQVSESHTMLSKAELNLAQTENEVAVQVELAYDKVEQMQNLVALAEEVLKARTEGARVADRQFEQNETLASARDEAVAKMTSAKASLLEANLGLSLAQGELQRAMGEIPR
jgi:outer membrane protein TolC